MSFGKSTSTTSPTLTPEQQAQIKAQTDFFTGTIAPTYKGAVGGATDIYNQNAGGVLNAAQNQAAVARQAQEALGGTGESALRTGVSGLQGLFGKDYEQNQIQAALAPAQAQYQQNIANQQAGFGAAGNLGSARQALAGQQAAGANAAQQAQIAAQVANQVAQQRQGAATSLMGYGGQALPGAISAANQIVGAANIPMDAYGRLASIAYGAPQASYNQMGPTGTSTSGKSAGAKLPWNF
jgi:hypothetical protein